MNKYKIASQKIGLNPTLLKKALTHYSFFENKDELKGNGRYIFAGMYAFKGEAAKVAVKYINGTGTQLQHLLGNAFSNEKLHTLFDEFKLSNLVRAGNNFDVKKHKHIFVYAILGCLLLYSKDQDKIQRFIIKYFFKDLKIVIPQNRSSINNFRTQADFMAEQIYKQKLILSVEKNNDMYCAKVKLKDDTFLLSAVSKSYRYVRKKVLKSAIRIMSELLAQPFENNQDYLLKIKERIEKQKLEYAAKLKQKQEEKEKLRLESSEKRKKLAKIREKERLKAKAEAKARRLAREKLQEQSASKAAKPMSANKRRYLEDKEK